MALCSYWMFPNGDGGLSRDVYVLVDDVVHSIGALAMILSKPRLRFDRSRHKYLRHGYIRHSHMLYTS